MRKSVISGFSSEIARIRSGRLRRLARLTVAIGPVVGALFAFAGHSSAQTIYTWDPGETGSGSDGSGAWNTTTNIWSSNSTDVDWVNGTNSFAVIGDNGTAGTITLGTGILTGSLQFNATSTGDYLITGSTITAAYINVNYAGNPGTFNGPTISSVIAGSSGLSFTGGVNGNGTLTVNGTNTYTGNTFVTSGLLIVNSASGLGAATNNLQLGESALNNLNGSNSVTSAGMVNINANVSIGTLSVISNENNNNNVVNIGSGDTLTASGGILIGEATNYYSASTTTVGQVATLTVNGTGGTLKVTGGNVIVCPGASSAAAGDNATLNLANLNTFLYSNTGGTLAVGGGQDAMGQLTLASASSSSSNVITAATIVVGTSNTSNANTGSVLVLGQGSNVLNCNSLGIGTGKSTGSVLFNTNFPTGSVTIAGLTGGTSVANITVENELSGTGNSPSNLLLAGNSATVHGGIVIVGEQSGATGGSNIGNLTFDTGTFSANSLQLGVLASGTSTGGIYGNFTLGGANVNSTATGVLTVGSSTTPGTFILGQASVGTGQANASFVMNGGSANIFANIIATAAGTLTNINSQFQLNGGTLNMEGYSIGANGLPINNVQLANGGTATAVLMNLGGVGVNSQSNNNNATSGLTMNGSGTLLLMTSAGETNYYSGVTTVQNGLLEIGTGNPVKNSALNPSGGSLSFSAGLGSTTVGGLTQGGNVTLADVNSNSITMIVGNIGGTFSGQLTGPGSVTIAGNNSSVQVFTGGNNNYTGSTSINSGTLLLEGGQLYNGIPSAPAVNVAGGTLGGSNGTVNGAVNLASGVIAPDIGGQLNFNSLTDSGGTLAFTLSGNNIGDIDVSAAAHLTSGALEFLVPSGTFPQHGTYTILSAGTLTNGLSLAEQTTSNGTEFQPFLSGDTLEVSVSGGPSFDLWIGANNNGTWDVGTTANWNNQTTNVSPSVFHNGDSAAFDDSASNFHVNVSGQVQPSTLTFNNNNNAYTISSTNGGGISGSTQLIMSGGGTVTINTVNSYTGDTDVNNGLLILGSGGVIASGNVNINNGEFNVNGGGTLSSTNLNVSSGTLSVASGSTLSSSAALLDNGQTNLGGAQSISTLNGTNSNATLQLAGTLTVSGGGTFQGTVVNGSGAGSLDISGGTLDLLGPNTYSGPTTIASGATLQLDNGNTNATLNSSSAVADNGTLIFDRSDNPTFGNNISGSGSLQQNGGGTITLTGNNPYTGGTYINNGGIITTTSNSLGSTLGTVNLGTAISLAAANTVPNTTNVGALTLNANQTIGTFLCQTDNSSSNFLTISNTSTLTVNGPFTVGVSDSRTVNTTVVNTYLTANGGGGLVVNGPFLTGLPSNNAGGKDTAVVTLASLSFVTVNDPTGEFGVGYGANVRATLFLANTNGSSGAAPANYINVSSIDVGNTQQGNDPNSSSMLLGNGPNTLYANTINLGLGKTGGSILFQTTATSGSVIIAGTNGVGAASITVGNASSASEGSGRYSQLLLAGHTANVTASALIIGENTNNTSNGALSTVTFDTGTFSAQTVLIAADTGGSSATGVQGTLALGGAAASTATEVFTTDSIVLGDFTNTAVSGPVAGAALIVNGGTLNVYGNISVTSTAGSTISDLTLAGNGVLNMEGNSIGGPGALTGNDGVTASLAPNSTDVVTLEDLGGAGLNGAGLTVNPTGTLILDGVNTYTGGTTISGGSGGTVQVGQASSSPLASPLGAASGAVTNNGKLVFGSNSSLIVANAINGSGSVTQNGNGLTSLTGTSGYTGATTVNAGTLSIEGVITSAVTVNNGSLAGSGKINAGVTLDGGSITPDASGTALSVSSLNVSGGTLQFNVSGANIGQIADSGAATLGSGAISFGLLSAPTKNSYTILTSSSLSNSLSLSPFSAGRTTFTPAMSGNTLTVSVTGSPAALTWTGASSTAWDVQTSQNWTSSALSNPDEFFQFDNVAFNDSNSGHYAVNLTTALTPLSVTVTTAGDYVFSGSGSIGGSTNLSLSGGGTLSLGNTGANTYSGGTSIGGGDLQVAAAGALPNGGSVSIASGTLDLDGNSVTVGAISGSGVITNSSATSAATLSFAGLTPSTFAGTIQNGASKLNSLTISSSTLTLSGNNTYTGPTTINSTAELIVNGPLSASTPITDGGQLVFGSNSVVANNISGFGALNQVGAGTLTLTGNNSYGPTVISSVGAVQVGSGGAAGSIGSGQIVDNGALIFDLSSSVRVANAITGPGVLIQNGTGTVNLVTNSTYSGGTTINNGALAVSGTTGNTALGSGNVTVNAGGTLIGADQSAFGFAPHVAPVTITINAGGTVTDLGTSDYGLDLPFVVFNGGTLTSAAGNTGGSDFSATQANLANYTFVGDTTNALVTTNASSTTAVINAATIEPAVGIIGAPNPTYAEPLTFNVAQGTTPSGVDLLVTSEILNPQGGTFSFPMVLTKEGAGLLEFTGSNAYTGMTNLNAGTLAITSDAGVDYSNGGLVFNGGTLQYNNYTSTMGFGSTNVGTGNVSLGAATGAASTLSGSIDAGPVNFVGPGKLILTGSNSYGGATTVSGGTLAIASVAALPANTSVAISGTGSKLQLATTNGTYDLAGLSVLSGSTLDVGNNVVLLSYGVTDPVASIASYLADGFNAGWAAGEISSSAVVAANASQSKISYSIGYADGADGSTLTTLPSGEIEILPTIAGDAKMQGNVVFGDFQILAQYFGKVGGWDEGNFKYGPTVNFGDFQLLAQDFGDNSGGLTSGEFASLNSFAEDFGYALTPNAGGTGFSLVSVPEPASMAMVGIALGALAVRRRRR